MNKVILIGRLSKDVESKTTQSGTAVANFTLAVDKRVKQGEQKQADFINCVAWSKTAEFVGRYFTKGLRVAVVGRIETRSWEGTDGKKHYATEVIAEEVEFADGKNGGNTNSGSNLDVPPTANDDDLPF